MLHEVDLVGPHSAGAGKSSSVTIGDGCWISARVTICPGVKLPPKSIIAVGATVTKVSPPKEGILTIRPAKVIKACIARE